MSDPIDLDAHRPHEVSKMLCARCGHKWTAVHPVGTTGLECPNCHGMKGYGMTDLIEKVRAAIDAAPWVERRDSFGTMHDTRAEARAAIAAVAEWLENDSSGDIDFIKFKLRSALEAKP